MQNYIRISLISLVLLLLILIFRPTGVFVHIQLPQWLQLLHQNLLAHFDHPENANFLFSVLTGEKKGISPLLLRDLSILNLRFLLSPSGLHLTGLLYFNKKRKSKFPIYLACWLIPSFYSLKRIALLRALSIFRKKLSQITLFYITFIISFLCGHFFKSPMGFTYSFLIIGTFLSLNELSRFKSFIAIAASYLLLAFFNGDSFSFLGLGLALILVNVFSFLLPVLIIFIGTFYIFPSHWGEPIIRLYIILIHFSAKLVTGTFFTSSFMLLCVLWVFLLNKHLKWLIVCLLLHAELSQAPLITFQSSRPEVQRVFGRR